jgi:hypothetical protein
MPLEFCSDLSAAEWISAGARGWPQLIMFGPPGLPAYARLRFLPDPAHRGQSENEAHFDADAPSESAQLRAVLDVLARYTSTPDECYFCLWDGWGWTVAADGAWTLNVPAHAAAPDTERVVAAQPDAIPTCYVDESDERPRVPMVVLADRSYFLFRGPVSAFGDWGPTDVPTDQPPALPLPAFAWPADHAWCVARDVDPHWAGIGADTAAIDQLIDAPNLDVVAADPREAQPVYW